MRPLNLLSQFWGSLQAAGAGARAAVTRGRRVLVTLWDVNDQSTADFMKLFYENLQAGGVSKAEAVQRSMR